MINITFQQMQKKVKLEIWRQNILWKGDDLLYTMLLSTLSSKQRKAHKTGHKSY